MTVAIIRSWRLGLVEGLGVGPIVAATVLRRSHPGRVHSEAASRCSPAWHRSRPTVATSPPVTGSTPRRRPAQATHCTLWFRAGSSTSKPPARVRLSPTAEGRPAESSTLPCRDVGADLYRLQRLPRVDEAQEGSVGSRANPPADHGTAGGFREYPADVGNQGRVVGHWSDRRAWWQPGREALAA